MGKKRSAVLIAGPTASGKSAIALEKAKQTGGIVINADSMQVYDVLSVLTARPTAEDMNQVPHHLYGFVAPSERFSTGSWYKAVGDLIVQTDTDAIPLIFVGGTGLYFEALLNGVAETPDVPQSYVLAAEAELLGLDRDQRAALLASKDPEMAERLKEADHQRVARALSILAATGRSLAYWQDQEQSGLLEGFEIEKIVVDPGRDVSRERIAKRFAQMIDGGAVEEVAALNALSLDPGLPIMKAIGVREITAWKKGELTKKQAVEKGVIATSQYAKRQRTWLRNRMGDWPRLPIAG